jgi:hypothetical protein
MAQGGSAADLHSIAGAGARSIALPTLVSKSNQNARHYREAPDLERETHSVLSFVPNRNENQCQANERTRTF